MDEFRVVNVTNGHRYKFSQAKRLIEKQCACAWVEVGVTMRELSLDEMVKARSTQAKLMEPLAYAEIPGIRFDKQSPEERVLIWEAHQFAMQAAA